MFLQSVNPIFDSFNTFPQSEEEIVHILYHATLRLYGLLLSRFILPEVISGSDDMLYIDPVEPDILKDFNRIFIGAVTKQYAKDSDIIGTSEYKKLLKEVRAFFIKCAKYLQTSMLVLKNDVIKSLTFLPLSERHQATLDERFPRVIIDMNALE